MKRVLSFLCLATAFALLAGCGGEASSKASSAPSSASAVSAASASSELPPGPITFTVLNNTDYAFSEVCVSLPDAALPGENLLGGSALEAGSLAELQLPPQEAGLFDLLVVDEDKDRYLFRQVPLENGAELGVSFADGLVVEVKRPGGEKETLAGVLETETSGAESSPENSLAGEAPQSQNVDASSAAA